MRASTVSHQPFPWVLRLHADATSHEALVADLPALAKVLATPGLSRVDVLAILETSSPAEGIIEADAAIRALINSVLSQLGRRAADSHLHPTHGAFDLRVILDGGEAQSTPDT